MNVHNGNPHADRKANTAAVFAAVIIPHPSDEPKVAAAREAVAYLLNRVRETPDARYLMGAWTQSLALLLTAGAALSDPPVTEEQIKDYVFDFPHQSLGESAWDQIKRLKKQVEELGGEP